MLHCKVKTSDSASEAAGKLHYFLDLHVDSMKSAKIELILQVKSNSCKCMTNCIHVLEGVWSMVLVSPEA